MHVDIIIRRVSEDFRKEKKQYCQAVWHSSQHSVYHIRKHGKLQKSIILKAKCILSNRVGILSHNGYKKESRMVVMDVYIYISKSVKNNLGILGKLIYRGCTVHI